MDESAFLKKTIQRKNGLVNMKIVFVDIIAFSKRKSKIQYDIVNKFTELTKKATQGFSQQYIDYAQKNNVNFSTDLIIIPTGDGVLVSFIFEGLERPHLDFSIELLRHIYEYNNSSPCSRFDENNWCNCHPKFNIRIGIDEGQGIVFTDLNENYNVTGNVINMASRIMDMADENTIIMGENAYKNLIDMASDVTIEDDFRCYEHIRVKHDVFLNVYQYCPKQEQMEFINTKKPESIQEFEQQAHLKDVCTNLKESLSGPNGFLVNLNMQESFDRADQLRGVYSELLKIEKNLVIPGFMGDQENQAGLNPENLLEAMSSMIHAISPLKQERLIKIDRVHDIKEE